MYRKRIRHVIQTGAVAMDAVVGSHRHSQADSQAARVKPILARVLGIDDARRERLLDLSDDHVEDGRRRLLNCGGESYW